MRTFPSIDLAVFSDPAEREQIKILADMGRQVSGALSRSIFPGQSPAANPVPSPSNPSSGGDLPTPVQGDLIYGTAAGWAKLPIVASGTFVSRNGTTPSWASFAATVDIVRTWAALQTFKDTTIKVVDDGDVTKAFQWSLGGATTGKTATLISSHTDNRSVTLPDATTTLAGLAIAQTFTQTQTISKSLAFAEPWLNLLDTDSGFIAQLGVGGGISGDVLFTLPVAASPGGDLAAYTGGGFNFAEFSGTSLDATCTVRSGTATNGFFFRDTTTSSKRLRVVLSGAVGNNAIVVATTAARQWTLGNVPGLCEIVGNGADPPASGAVGIVNRTAQVAAIGATNLTNTTPAGYYVVNYTLETTTADVTAGTIQV